MRFPTPLSRGRLIQRYKRFLADIEPDDGGPAFTAHVPNPGAMLGLNTPGLAVWYSTSDSLTRKLPRTLELVEADGTLVGVNTHHPNRLVAEALAEGWIPELAGYATIRPEVKYGEASRIDFLLTHPERPALYLEVKNCQTYVQTAERLWLEVKNCHLSRGDGLAEFPDCVAARSAKHLRELEKMVAAGDRAAVLFTVQREDCDRFSACHDIDPVFAAALDQAANAGVEVLVYQCEMSTQAIRLTKRIEWKR